MSKFDMKTAIESISNGLATIETSDDWIRYLKFCSNFYNYSYGNIILIMMQRPNASFVAGFTAWRKMNRYVKKGEKGIAILCPCIRKVETFAEPDDVRVYNDKEAEKEVKKVVSGFRIGHVFDIAQTDGDDSMLPVLVTGLQGSSEQEKAVYEALLRYVSLKYCVQEVEGISAKGSYNIETKVITVRSDLQYQQKLKSLLHELSHAIDFEMNPDLTTPRNKRELIAESCAFVICLRLGIDTSSYSFSYLKSWMKDPKELGEVADCVQKIASKVINELAGSDDLAFSDLVEE